LELFRPIQMISVAIGDHDRNLVISPRHVDKEQSMDWRHKASSHPKNSECKNPPENFSPRFFGIKTANSSLIIFQRNYHHGVLLISAGAPDGHFEKKNATGKSPGWSCSCTRMFRLNGHLQPRRY